MPPPSALACQHLYVAPWLQDRAAHLARTRDAARNLRGRKFNTLLLGDEVGPPAFLFIGLGTIVSAEAFAAPVKLSQLRNLRFCLRCAVFVKSMLQLWLY